MLPTRVARSPFSLQEQHLPDIMHLNIRKRKRLPRTADFLVGAMVGLSIVVAVFVMLA